MSSLMRNFSITAVLATSIAGAAQVRFETIAQQAETARTQDRVPDAIRLYREGTQLRPSWLDGWWYLGSLLYDQDRFSDAAVAFQHVLSDTPHRGPASAFLALCDYETGKYDDALAQFRGWARMGWAGTRELRDVADYHFALLLTRDGKFVESLFLIAPLAQRLGDNPELVEAMGLASLRMRFLPENFPPEKREPIWLAGKAALYAAQYPKDFERADEYASRLESRYGTQPEIHYFRGTLYGFEGKNAEAEREYREELKLSPDHVRALVALAGFDLDKNEVAEAAALTRRAVAADPNDAEAHHVFGRVLLITGDLHASASELERAKQIAPDSPLIRSLLAMVYNKLGRKLEAKEEAAAFLTLKNKEEVMASAEEKLGGTREKAH